MRIIVLLVLSLCLFACATTQNYQKALSSWQGASINQLVRVWGYPTKESRAPSGNKLYIYHFEQKGRNPIYKTGPTTNVVKNGEHITVSTHSGVLSGGGTFDYKCVTWVEVNGKGVIVNTAFRGNNCVATKSFLDSHRNPSTRLRRHN